MNPKSRASEPAKVAGTVTESAPAVDTPWTPPSPTVSADLPECDPVRYEALGEVGAGGLGIVRKVYDHRLDRAVALKELQERSRSADARFVREAKLSARLEHPGIVPIHDVGRWPNGDPFYCMKLVSGRSLKEAIAACSSFEQRLALLGNVLVVADAIAFAHSQRIIHRDLKPSNIIVGEYGETIVIDWGLAKDISDESTANDCDAGPYRTAGSQGLTVAGTVLGTPAYMSPEQARGEPVDESTDIYALGAILYQVLAGVAPYSGDTTEDILRGVLGGLPAPLDETQPGVPADLAAIVNKAMARERGDRYASAKALADDLRRFQTGQLVGAHAYTALDVARRWLRRYRLPVAVATVAIVALLVLGAVSLERVFQERDAAERARNALEDERNGLILVQSEHSLATDPTAALAWLRHYRGQHPELAQGIAADAVSRGVARRTIDAHSQRVVIVSSLLGGDFVTSGADRALHSWSASGEHNGEITSDLGPAALAAVSPSRRRLAHTTGAGVVVVRDVEAGVTRILRPPFATMDALRFSPGGRYLVAERSGEPYLSVAWDLVHDRPLQEVAGFDVRFAHDDDMYSYQDRDDRLVVARMSDPASPPRLVRPHAGRATWAPAGASLAYLAMDSSGNDMLVRQDVERGHVDTVTATTAQSRGAFAPDGDALAVVRVGGRSLLVVENDGTEFEVDLPAEAVGDPSFSHDGEHCAVIAGTSIVVAHRATRSVTVLQGHSEIWPTALAWAPDQPTLVAGDYGGRLRIWELNQASHAIVGRGAGPILSLGVTEDNARLAAGSGTHVHVWSLDEKRLLHDFDHSDAVWTVRLRPDGSQVATSLWNGEVTLRNLPGGELLRIDTPLGRPAAMRYSPDGRWLWMGFDGGALWKVAPETAAVSASHQMDDTIRRIEFDPAGNRVAVTVADAVLVADATTAKEWVRFASEKPTAIRFAPRGTFLVVGDESGTVRRIDLPTGRGHELARLGAKVTDVAISRSERWLAAASGDGSVILFDTSTSETRQLHGHEGLVYSVSFSSDECHLATAGRDGTVRLWRTNDGAQAVLRGHSGYARFATILDGERILSVGEDGAARIWSATEPRDLVELLSLSDVAVGQLGLDFHNPRNH